MTTASITINNNIIAELPVLEGTQGPNVIDISSLYKNSGYFTYDPGFMSTASCKSAITYIDGEAGILEHRGYRIESLAEESDFPEVAHLLLYGELPTVPEKETFISRLMENNFVHEQVHFLLRGFPRRAHPMPILIGTVASLSAFYHDSLDMNDPAQRECAAIRMIAKMPALVAMAYRYSVGLPFVYPRDDLDYSANFLHMMFSMPGRTYNVSSVQSKALDQLLILQADHEQNASTSTVRLTGSSGADPFVCIGAGIASLWGPLHGGANEEVLKMLEQIGSSDRISEFLKRAKDKNDPFRLMGFGHRVYKNHDPRAQVIRKSCHAVLDELGIHDPLLEIAKELERIALEDDYFVSRKLFPNIDFYSGIIYKALGIPTTMFTPMFSLARTAGWVAQWKEMTEDDSQKIGRPRQLYIGAQERPFLPIHKRGKD